MTEVGQSTRPQELPELVEVGVTERASVKPRRCLCSCELLASLCEANAETSATPS